MYHQTEIKSWLNGLWPAMFTPSLKDGKVNIAELEKLVEMLIVQGVDGLYVLGSTGQGFLFPEAERNFIAEKIIEIVSNRVPVIVQVGALSTDECCRLATRAEKAGAAAISSVGPIYYAARGDAAFEHYRLIADSVEIPFIPYQIGTSTGAQLIYKLLEIPNVAGMKLTTANLLEINQVARITNGRWQLFSGADELICQAAMCGTAGAIGSTYNLLPALFKNVRRRFLNGEVQMGIEFMQSFQNLIEDILPFIYDYYHRGMILKHNIDIGKTHMPILQAPLNWTDEQIMESIDKLESIAQKYKSSNFRAEAVNDEKI